MRDPLTSRLATLPRRILGRALGWRRDEGVAAVEFALVLPLMMTLFFGLSDLTLAVNLDRKLTLLTRSLADIPSRVPSLTTSDLGNVFAAASAVMRPYDSTNVQMVLSSVLVTVNGSTYTGKVDWSCPKNIPSKPNGQSQADFDAENLKARSASSAYDVPTGYQTTTTKSFLVAETLVPYTSTFGQYLAGTTRLRETMTWPVRGGDKVTGPGNCPA